MQVAQLNAQLQGQLAQQRQQVEQAKLQLQAQRDQATLADKQEARNADLQREMLRQQSAARISAEDNIVRERMNTADNDTAMRLAAAEIMSGEKIAVSTGTGINPGTR